MTLTVEFVVNERGFTLLEVTAVVLIAGLIMATTLPGVFEYRSTMRRAQAREMVLQDMRSARQTAVTQRVPVIVAFGNGSTTSNVTSYTIHTDNNGDHLYQSTELRTTHTLPPETKLYRVLLTPTDSLFFDISGVLTPGTSGGSLIVIARAQPETLLVSGAGMIYQQ